MVEFFDPEQVILNFFKKKDYEVGYQVRNTTTARIYVYNNPGSKPFSVTMDLHVSDVYNKTALTEALERINGQIEEQLETKVK